MSIKDQVTATINKTRSVVNDMEEPTDLEQAKAQIKTLSMLLNGVLTYVEKLTDLIIPTTESKESDG